MERTMTPADLAVALDTTLVLDARRQADYDTSQEALPGSTWYNPEQIDAWIADLPKDQEVAIYCVRGGHQGPLHRGLEGRRRGGSREMKWVTRERPKIDRIACPWLIARFIDAAPEFLYVPGDEVMRVAAETGATPYDLPGVEYGHQGDRCSFDAFIDKHRLTDPALQKLALIVRAADCGQPQLAKEAAGLLAISKGLSLNFEDDLEMLSHGMVIDDALYAWCAETPPLKAT